MDQNANITRVLRELEAFDIAAPAALKYPASITQAFDEAIAADPVGELAAKIAAGKLKPADAGKALLDAGYRVAAADQAQAVRQSLQRSLNQQTAIALRDAGDQIIEGLRPHFDVAVALLTEAHEILGDEPDKALTLAAPGLRSAWGQREEGLEAFQKVHSLRHRLAEAGYGNDRTGQHAPLWYIEGLSPLGAPATARPWDLIVGGFTPHLNTAAEVDALRAELEGQHRATEAAAIESRLTPRDRTQAVRQDRIIAKEAARAATGV